MVQRGQSTHGRVKRVVGGVPAKPVSWNQHNFLSTVTVPAATMWFCFVILTMMHKDLPLMLNTQRDF